MNRGGFMIQKRIYCFSYDSSRAKSFKFGSRGKVCTKRFESASNLPEKKKENLSCPKNLIFYADS